MLRRGLQTTFCDEFFHSAINISLLHFRSARRRERHCLFLPDLILLGVINTIDLLRPPIMVRLASGPNRPIILDHSIEQPLLVQETLKYLTSFGLGSIVWFSIL